MKKTFFSFFICLCFSGLSFAVIVKDETGVKFTFLSPPKRIISTMPSNTEILFSLGLGKKVIAVSNKCDYPLEVKRLPKVGDLNLNIEKIISLNPDLIIMLYDAQKYQIEKMRSLHLPVFVINPKSLEGLARSIELLGKATNSQQKATQLVKKIYAEIDKSLKRAKKNKPKVFVVLWPNPLITVGKNTFIDDIVQKSGGENIAAKIFGAYPTVDFEFVLKANPDFIVFVGKSYPDFKKIISDNKWQRLPAIKDGKVLIIDSDIITRPTMRSLKSLELISIFINSN